MTFKTISDDIIVSEGTFGYSFIASGTIYGGQLVKPAGPMQVVKSESCTDNSIGVAAYSVTKGESVTVYGPGNVVRGHCPSATALGADLYTGNDGCFDDTATYGLSFPSVGISLDQTVSGNIRILLK